MGIVQRAAGAWQHLVGTITADDLNRIEGNILDLDTRTLNVDQGGAAAGMVPAVSGTGPTSYKLMDYFKVLVAQLDPLITGTITRDANGAATSAPVAWPDGTTGVYTATTVSTAFPGAVDAYTVTYDPAGTANDRTYTQPAVTRDANGAVTARPAVTVA